MMYYIFVYIQFVLLTPFLGKLAKAKYRYLGLLVSPIFILIFKYCGFESNAYVSYLSSTTCLVWFTYYYLGFLLGNQCIKPIFSLKKLVFLYAISIVLQIIEGYYWLQLGIQNCGTQIKLTSFLTSTLFLLIVYTILRTPTINIQNKLLLSIGNYSFGIYLCHIMLIRGFKQFYCYNVLPFPLISIIIILISLLCCYIGNKICGRKISGWLGFK